MKRRMILWITIAASIGLSLLPFVWFASVSFQPPVEITSPPPRMRLPATLDAYRSVLFEHEMPASVLNSLVVAGATAFFSVALGSLAGYAFARGRLAGRKWFLAAILAAAMFPQITLAGPIWRLLGTLGLLNTLSGLTLPHIALSLPLTIWVLASFFKDLPRDLEEAARVDGCGLFGTLLHVVAPLAAPGVFTAGILAFIHSWNEFFFALLVLSDPAKHTLPLAIALFPGRYTMPWGEIAAACVLATVPLVVVALVFQKRIVSGLTAGALKS